MECSRSPLDRESGHADIMLKELECSASVVRPYLATESLRPPLARAPLGKLCEW